MIKQRRKKKQEFFEEWKINKGCQICGYNKCPASLDLHHKEGKDFRIRQEAFWSAMKHKGERASKELDKCILLCKNCHYELHYNELN